MLVVDVYLASFLIAFGICGNILSVLALRRDVCMRRTTRFLLQVLAVTDIVYLLLSVLYQPLFAIAFDPITGPQLVGKYLIIEPYVSPLISTASMAGTWIIVLVTVDRYVAICYPLHAKLLFTTHKIRIFVVCVWVFLFNCLSVCLVIRL